MRDIHNRDPESGRVHDPKAHAQEVQGMFARIAGVYDFMNHLLSLNLDRLWRKRLANHVDPDVEVILDLCAGTGDLGLACLKAGRGKQIVAVDFVSEMLRGLKGKRYADQAWPVTGDGLAIPLPDASVDTVVAGFGVRNLADPEAGLHEMIRVVKPGGRMLVLEFFKNDPNAAGAAQGPSALMWWAMKAIVPLLGGLVARDTAAYSYLPGSMDRFLTVDQYQQLFRRAGCREVFAERMNFGVAHLVGGRRAG